MRGTPAWSILSLLAALFLAGCASSGAASNEPAAPAARVAAPGDAHPDAGTVGGFVTDDSFNPVPGAQVSLIDLGASASADEDGAFQITNVPPGRHKIAAAALGYNSVIQLVTVGPREDVVVNLMLTALAIREPYHHTFPIFQGYFECRLAYPNGLGRTTGPCPAVPTTNDKSQFRFDMQNETMAIVGEMRWQQGSYATSQMLRMSFSYQGRPSTHWWCTDTSPSPIHWVYAFDEAGDGACDSQAYCGTSASQGTTGDHSVPKAKHPLIVYTNTPFGCHDAGNLRPIELAFQQKFEMAVTIFQSSHPPERFSGFPDM